MKRLVTIFITVLFLGTLAGCGAVPNEGPGDGTSSQAGGGVGGDGSSVGRPGGYGSNLDDPNGTGGGMRGEMGRLVHFDFNSAMLTGEAEEVLAYNARQLSKTSGRIQVEGHCDERGTREYNLALGQQRADAAARYLISQGIDASRIKTISYGKERPLVRGHEDQSWAQNRRAEVVPQ